MGGGGGRGIRKEEKKESEGGRRGDIQVLWRLILEATLIILGLSLPLRAKFNVDLLGEGEVVATSLERIA